MKLYKLLAGLGLATGIFLTHVQSNQSPDFTSLKSADAGDGLSNADLVLVDALQRQGVRVGVSSDCPPRVEGLYHPVLNILVLCDGVSHSGGIGDTLRHEAVHAAQDCAAGLSNDQLQPILPQGLNPFTGDASHSSLSRFIASSYPNHEHRALEFEAWSIARGRSSQQVANIVHTHCTPK